MVPKPISRSINELKNELNKSITPYTDKENLLRNKFLDTKEYTKDNTCITKITKIFLKVFLVLVLLIKKTYPFSIKKQFYFYLQLLNHFYNYNKTHTIDNPHIYLLNTYNN